MKLNFGRKLILFVHWLLSLAASKRAKKLSARLSVSPTPSPSSVSRTRYLVHSRVSKLM